MGASKLIFIALVIMPLKQGDSIGTSVYLSICGLMVFFCVVSIIGMNKYHRRREVKDACRRKKHRVHLPKNTTLSVEIDK